jgi:hypothetical protein
VEKILIVPDGESPQFYPICELLIKGADSSEIRCTESLVGTKLWAIVFMKESKTSDKDVEENAMKAVVDDLTKNVVDCSQSSAFKS